MHRNNAWCGLRVGHTVLLYKYVFLNVEGENGGGLSHNPSINGHQAVKMIHNCQFVLYWIFAVLANQGTIHKSHDYWVSSHNHQSRFSFHLHFSPHYCNILLIRLTYSHVDIQSQEYVYCCLWLSVRRAMRNSSCRKFPLSIKSNSLNVYGISSHAKLIDGDYCLSAHDFRT